VKNLTEVSALNVRVCDTLPSGLTVASAPGFSMHGNTLRQAIGTLKVLAAGSLSFTARVTASVSSLLTNRATAIPRNARTVRARARITVGLGLPSPAEPSRRRGCENNNHVGTDSCCESPISGDAHRDRGGTIHVRDPAELV
jgi:hypothetical protein